MFKENTMLPVLFSAISGFPALSNAGSKAYPIQAPQETPKLQQDPNPSFTSPIKKQVTDYSLLYFMHKPPSIKNNDRPHIPELRVDTYDNVDKESNDITEPYYDFAIQNTKNQNSRKPFSLSDLPDDLPEMYDYNEDIN